MKFEYIDCYLVCGSRFQFQADKWIIGLIGSWFGPVLRWNRELDRELDQLVLESETGKFVVFGQKENE